MAQTGIGDAIHVLRKKIQQIQSELDSDGSFDTIPEMIDSANLLRFNEYLHKKVQKQDELVATYKEYSKSLEQMISILFEIQVDLKDVLKEQSLLMSKTKRRRVGKKTS